MILVILAAVGIVGLLFGLLAVVMVRAGVSLRPLVFVAGMLLIIGGPQVVYHVAVEEGWIGRIDPFGIGERGAGADVGYVENEGVLGVASGRFLDPSAVFGPSFDPDLLSDVRSMEPFDGAEAAMMAILPPTSMAILARFLDSSEASKALDDYISAATGTRPTISSNGLSMARRPIGDVVGGLIAGRTLVILSGPDEEALVARLSVLPGVRASDTADTGTGGYAVPVLSAVIAILLVVSVLWFFRGSTWAASVPARDNVRPVDPDQLRGRLLAVNDLDVPFSILEEHPGGRLIATWRFADARWVDMAQAHGMRRTHRILLELDEKRRSVRSTEFASRLDWSAGPGGGSHAWRVVTGIQFFQVEHRRVFGIQVDDSGRFVPHASYAYTFDLQEMKAPIIAAVTRSGWSWRPTVWHGPRWLRWLTD